MLVVIFLACLGCNVMLVAADDCHSTVTQPNFDANKFSGIWYGIYQPPEMYKTYKHWIHNFGPPPQYILNGSAISTDNDQQISYTGTWKPTTPGYFQAVVTTVPYSGPYSVVTTDYTCYAVLRGCPEGGNIRDLIWIQFTKEKPTEECENNAKEALKKAQLDPNAVKRDETY